MTIDDFAAHFVDRFPDRVGGSLLVALSGGPDSVALLHLLRHAALRLVLEAAHVHHGVRAAEADADADFCRRLCADLAIELHVVRIELADSAPAGREASWREARYRALLDIAGRRGLDAVATGHQRDDVAEGVLMQLLRGAGTRAMSGIAERTPDGVLRPLLPWSRSEIADWLRENRLEWRQDSSNLDLSHLRNRVRHALLPALREAAPAVDRHLVTLAGQLAADESYFAAELARVAAWIDPWSPAGGVAAAVIRDMPRPLRARWLHAQIARLGIGTASRHQVDLLHRMVDRGEPRAVALAGRWRLRMVGRRLWLEPPQLPAGYAVDLRPRGSTPLPIPGWRVLVGESKAGGGDGPWSRSVAASSRLTVRSPAPDDVVRDGTRTRRVSKMLAGRWPRHLRSCWPVFRENGTITWIPGVWSAPASGETPVEVVTNGRAAGRLHR